MSLGCGNKTWSREEKQGRLLSSGTAQAELQPQSFDALSYVNASCICCLSREWSWVITAPSLGGHSIAWSL